MKTKTWTIYRLTSPSGKHYIGQTVRPFQYRMTDYRRMEKKHNIQSQKKIHAALQKYGFDNFKRIELETGILTLEEALRKEELQIEAHDSFHNGYNCTKGGDGCRRGNAPFPQFLWIEGKLVVPFAYSTKSADATAYSRQCRNCYAAMRIGRWSSTPEHEVVLSSMRKACAEIRITKRIGSKRTFETKLKMAAWKRPLSFSEFFEGKLVVSISASQPLLAASEYRRQCNCMYLWYKKNKIQPNAAQMEVLNQMKADMLRDFPEYVDGLPVVPISASSRQAKTSAHRHACHRMWMQYFRHGMTLTEDQLKIIAQIKKSTPKGKIPNSASR